MSDTDLQLPSFFMTYARSRPSTLVPYIEKNDIPLLTNAVHRWSDAQEDFLSMWEYDTPHVIDAGGYNVQRQWVTERRQVYGEMTAEHAQEAVERDPEGHQEELDSGYPFYPWTVQQYHEWLESHADELTWATAMDYACEEKFDPLWSVQERVDATFENTLEQYNLDPSYQLLPVLQGRSADEYVDFYERLEDHGLPIDYVGLGTVCRLSSEKKIQEMEQEIRDRTDVEYLHGFGVKVAAFKHGAAFDSADSQAWAYYPSNGTAVISDGGSLRKVEMHETHLSLERTTTSFKEYYSHATDLLDGVHQ